MQRKEPTDVLGLDFSSLQGIENEDLLFYNSPNFVYLRAYGSNHAAMDSTFVERVAKAKKYGVPCGAYYFGTPKATADIVGSAQAEADQFVKALYAAFGTGNAGDCTPFLDIEEYKDPATGKTGLPKSSGMTARQLIDWIKAFRDYFYLLTKRRVGFYSNRWFMTDPSQMGVSDDLLKEISDMPLWLAEYDQWFGGISGNVQPKNLGGWDKYVLWQYAVLRNADHFGLTHGYNQVDHNRTKDISWIMPPPPITDFTLTDLGQGMLGVSCQHPQIQDYLGASVYVNGSWRAWISKTINEISIPNMPRGSALTVKLVTEDTYHDFTNSMNKTITLM